MLDHWTHPCLHIKHNMQNINSHICVLNIDVLEGRSQVRKLLKDYQKNTHHMSYSKPLKILEKNNL